MTVEQPELPVEFDPDELDDLLLECPDEDNTMLFAELEGYLAGVIVSPHPIPQDSWLPYIWGGSERAFPDDPARSTRLSELILARHREITDAFQQGGLAYAPYYDIDVDESPLWQIWAEGVFHAMAVSGKPWDGLLKSRDEDLKAAASGLFFFIAQAKNLEVDDSIAFEMDEAEAPDMLPYLVETLYRRQHGLRRVVLAEGPTRAAPKIGRNDPCPCGSGKKYKKCCLNG